MILETAGGGGYGSPLEREPERVLRDVIDGKVTQTAAAEVYGVVIDPERRSIDQGATQRRRAGMRPNRN